MRGTYVPSHRCDAPVAGAVHPAVFSPQGRAALIGARAALIGAALGDHLPRVRHDDEIPGSAGCGGARAGRYATGRGHGPTYGGCHQARGVHI